MGTIVTPPFAWKGAAAAGLERPGRRYREGWNIKGCAWVV
jgi:hypothetical protein